MTALERRAAALLLYKHADALRERGVSCSRLTPREREGVLQAAFACRRVAEWVESYGSSRTLMRPSDVAVVAALVELRGFVDAATQRGVDPSQRRGVNDRAVRAHELMEWIDARLHDEARERRDHG